MPSVLITGSRFASAPELAPIGATVITADEIRRAGVADVNQAIRKIGGVYGRQSLDSSPDFALDLRGFGTNSSQNMVVVLDGVRMNENELASPVLSTIPIETVERIEIIRGGSAVLYGEGATGGVIQIVTKRPGKRRRPRLGAAPKSASSASTTCAHRSRKAGKASRSTPPSATRAPTTTAPTAASARPRFSGGAQWTLGAGRVGVRIDSARQDSRFPGSLTLAQFQADPRQSLTPNDFGSLDSDRISAFVEQRVGGVELAAELSHREKTVKAHYVSIRASAIDPTWPTTASRPSFRRACATWRSSAACSTKLVAGVDLIRWKRVTNADFSKADASQDSKAIYLRDEIRWDAAHNGRFVARRPPRSVRQGLRRSARLPAGAGKQLAIAERVGSAGQLRVLPRVTLHAKAGQSYRMANVDENSYRSSIDRAEGADLA